ncbi:hypothetical protein CDAR_412891 [Caerostris darwini]|uniref:Uncharacterized protein n=1 Tax=Caerostris darwini TaxID=1538125 RepID=A0AAV4SHF7_9ARAC|nr:hypothetical protein CDAR_412891 [Caerostris darwini]
MQGRARRDARFLAACLTGRWEGKDLDNLSRTTVLLRSEVSGLSSKSSICHVPAEEKRSPRKSREFFLSYLCVIFLNDVSPNSWGQTFFKGWCEWVL